MCLCSPWISLDIHGYSLISMDGMRSGQTSSNYIICTAIAVLHIEAPKFVSTCFDWWLCCRHGHPFWHASMILNQKPGKIVLCELKVQRLRVSQNSTWPYKSVLSIFHCQHTTSFSISQLFGCCLVTAFVSRVFTFRPSRTHTSIFSNTPHWASKYYAAN